MHSIRKSILVVVTVLAGCSLSISNEDAKTAFKLAYDHEHGINVSIDMEKAAFYYRQAAEGGLAEAQYNLANAYRTGQGIEQDFKRAVQWYRNASDRGLPQAQYNLGAMFGNGEGVPQDYAQAYYWLLLSAKQGYAQADAYLNNFRPDLSPEMRSKIEQEVDRVRATYVQDMQGLRGQ